MERARARGAEDNLDNRREMNFPVTRRQGNPLARVDGLEPVRGFVLHRSRGF